MGALVTGLVTFFSWLADKAATLAVFLGQAALLMARLLWTFALQVGQVFAKVWGYFGQFWRNVLKPFVTWSWKEIQRLHGWLEREFRPLVSFLNDVRKHILDFYTKWLRPVFDTIEITRRLLQILASFHVAFAAELDRRLAAMEEILLRPITLALTKVNEAIDMVDQIVSWDGLFQRLTLLASVLRDIPNISAIWWRHQATGLSADEQASKAARAYKLTAPADYGAAMGAFYRDGSGELAPLIRELAPEWRAAATARATGAL